MGLLGRFFCFFSSIFDKNGQKSIKNHPNTRHRARLWGDKNTWKPTKTIQNRSKITQKHLKSCSFPIKNVRKPIPGRLGTQEKKKWFFTDFGWFWMLLDAFGWFLTFCLKNVSFSWLGRTFFWAISAEKVIFQVRKVEKSKKKHFSRVRAGV